MSKLTITTDRQTDRESGLELNLQFLSLKVTWYKNGKLLAVTDERLVAEGPGHIDLILKVVSEYLAKR